MIIYLHPGSSGLQTVGPFLVQLNPSTLLWIMVFSFCFSHHDGEAGSLHNVSKIWLYFIKWIWFVLWSIGLIATHDIFWSLLQNRSSKAPAAFNIISCGNEFRAGRDVEGNHCRHWLPWLRGWMKSREIQVKSTFAGNSSRDFVGLLSLCLLHWVGNRGKKY